MSLAHGSILVCANLNFFLLIWAELHNANRPKCLLDVVLFVLVIQKFTNLSLKRACIIR